MSRFRLPIALHPINEPVRTIEQARLALASDSAWFGSMNPRNNLAQPGGSAVGNEAGSWSALASQRRVERMALLMWEDRQQWETVPELGLVLALNVLGFEAEYHFNGPDHGASLGTSRFRFVPGLTPEQEREASAAFREVLATRWDEMDEASPMRGMLHVLANREVKKAEVSLESLDSLRESLMLPDHAACWRAQALEKAWAGERTSPSPRGPRL